MPVKRIWLGSGDFTVSCGDRGIAIECNNRFTYLLWWQKISHIYDQQVPQSTPFSRIWEEFEYEELPDGTYESGLSVRGDGLKGFILNDYELTNALPARNIRVRLYNNDPKKEYVEELIIPKSLFGIGENTQSWQDFMKRCWEFKYLSLLDQ